MLSHKQEQNSSSIQDIIPGQTVSSAHVTVLTSTSKALIQSDQQELQLLREQISYCKSAKTYDVKQIAFNPARRLSIEKVILEESHKAEIAYDTNFPSIFSPRPTNKRLNLVTPAAVTAKIPTQPTAKKSQSNGSVTLQKYGKTFFVISKQVKRSALPTKSVPQVLGSPLSIKKFLITHTALQKFAKSGPSLPPLVPAKMNNTWVKGFNK